MGTFMNSWIQQSQNLQIKSDTMGQLTNSKHLQRREPPNKSLRWPLTCWRLSYLCLARASKGPSLLCHLLQQRGLQRRSQQSVWSAPRCGAPGSAVWVGPAQPAAGQLFPVAVFGSAGAEAGHEAPRWLPAPHGWPDSGGCFCSMRG